MSSPLSLIAPKAAATSIGAAPPAGEASAPTSTGGDAAGGASAFAQALHRHTGTRDAAAADEPPRFSPRPAAARTGRAGPDAEQRAARLSRHPAVDELELGERVPLVGVPGLAAGGDELLPIATDIANTQPGGRSDPLAADATLLAAPAWPSWLPALPPEGGATPRIDTGLDTGLATAVIASASAAAGDATAAAALDAATNTRAATPATERSASGQSPLAATGPAATDDVTAGSDFARRQAAFASGAIRLAGPGGTGRETIQPIGDDASPALPPGLMPADARLPRGTPGGARPGRNPGDEVGAIRYGQPGTPVGRETTQPIDDGVARERPPVSQPDDTTVATAPGSMPKRQAPVAAEAAAAAIVTSHDATIDATREATRDALREVVTTTSAAPAEPAAPTVPGGAPLAAAPALATSPTDASATAPIEARIAVAIDQPGFAPALGAQLSLLARDGIQQARLQLHPAEMGPINVQIALDGSAARIDFHAAVAATRDAIEASLPSLASALRESGLTLAGGGVFQQAPGQQSWSDAQPGPGAQGGQGGQRGAAGERSGDPADADSRAGRGGARPVARRGLVDLIA